MIRGYRYRDGFLHFPHSFPLSSPLESATRVLEEILSTLNWMFLFDIEAQKSLESNKGLSFKNFKINECFKIFSTITISFSMKRNAKTPSTVMVNALKLEKIPRERTRSSMARQNEKTLREKIFNMLFLFV